MGLETESRANERLGKPDTDKEAFMKYLSDYEIIEIELL